MAEEVCRIIITQEATGLVNVSAPMQYKALCYNMLDDARGVVARTPSHYFFSPGRTLLITMDQRGVVDVAAPLPPAEWCTWVLAQARQIIEQYESSEQKQVPAGFADAIPL